ncbi:MAG: sulfatase-like hydrolase/transferase, partial [Colwellia sp.]|nr:sulfatase-like hydrolase/transferase [Colwellia sp.]
FRGYLGTVHEGSVRTPLIVRWPNKVAANKVSNEMIAMVDLFPTMANLAGASEHVPDDRPIDGMDMTDLLLNKVAASPRESVLLFSGEDLRAIKWRQFKIYFQGEHVGVMDQHVDSLWAPQIYNTMVDPKEMNNIGTENLWALYPAFHALMPFIYSVQQEGLIEPGGSEPTRYKIDIPFFRWEQIEEGLSELKKKAIKKKIIDTYDNIKSVFVNDKAN